MSLVGLLVVLVVVGVLVWLVQSAPIAQPFKWIVQAVLVVVLVVWLLEATGMVGPFDLRGPVRVGR